ncbi:hypothetical protein C8Q80DRAFT_1351706 [Daedaleopsis nitida]|nr:hypothetical protein C8Q80DRAFT_1351706 [Daedaleopsis nitida]
MSESPVQKVLLCHELLEGIFRQMSTGMVHPDDKPEDIRDRVELRRTLACSARVCQIFYEPALNVLWCALDNLVPLLRLLPGFEKRESTYLLDNSIADQDWLRLQHHASRIRGLCHYPCVSLHPSVWLALMARTQSQGIRLLPRLMVLDVDDMPLSDLGLLSIMLSPSLLELYISFHSDATQTTSLVVVSIDGGQPAESQRPLLPPMAGMLLETIAATASDLTICYMDEHFPAPRQHLSSLGRLTKLKELKLYDPEMTVDADALRAISSLQQLQTLSIEDLRLDGKPLELEDGYQALHTLYVHANPDDLLSLVRASRFTALKDVDFMIHCDDGKLPVDHFEHMFALLPITIYKIRLGFCDGPSTLPPAGPLADLLSSLQPLQGIRDLTIDTGARRLTGCDNELKMLADKWPGIRKFIFADDREHPRALSDPHPTFLGLVDLATRCRSLDTVSMPSIDTAGLPPLEQLPVLRHPLRWLEFNHYVGDASAEELADALDRMFPSLEFKYNVKSLPTPQEGTKPWHKIWDALQSRRKAVQPVGDSSPKPLGDVLELLRRFRDLLHVLIMGNARVAGYATDADMQTLGGLWPRLHSFQVSTRHPSHLFPCKLTFSGLAELARGCPELESLSMPLLATVELGVPGLPQLRRTAS